MLWRLIITGFYLFGSKKARKQMLYGMSYGMGDKLLALQLLNLRK